MSRTRLGEIAVDDDGTWCAWVTDSGPVRALGLWDADEGRIIDLGPGTTVHAGAGTGRFLVQDGETVRSWDPVAGLRDVGAAEPGALLLEAPGAEPDGGNRVAAASSDELVLFTGAGTLVPWRLSAPPLVLAWQHRRRGVLCVLSDGTVLKMDPATGSVAASALSRGEDYRLACYEEVLGGVWVVPERAPESVCFHRLETDPPELVYRLELEVRADAVRASHSGEWLIIRTPGRGATRLVNVNSGRSFTVPGELAARGAPCVFSFDNRLISVEGDAFEPLPVPARADIRARDGSLAIDTFWLAPPRMHRASRPQQSGRRTGEVRGDAHTGS